MEIDKQNGKLAFNFGALKSNVPSEEFTGIYVFYNKKYFYVGQSINVYKRIKGHKRRMSTGKHENVIIQRVFDKYSKTDPFIFEPLLQCNIDDLNYFEKYCFDELKWLNPNMVPMNISKCGGQGDVLKGNLNKSKSFKGKPHPWKQVKYAQLDKEGNLIKIWDSLSSAMRFYGSINAEKHTSYGYQWQRYQEYLIKPKGRVNHKHNIDDTIKQYDLNGALIAEYSSIKEASLLSGCSRTSICACLNGKHKTSNSFVWSYGDFKKVIINKRYLKSPKKVLQYTMNMEYIKTFKSLNNASKETGLTNYEIKRNINGYTENAGGFIWKYQK